MRTKEQLLAILNDSLSDSKWSRLKGSILGRELLYIGAEILYKYEILAYHTPTLAYSTDDVDTIKAAIGTALSAKGWDVSTDVSDAISYWAAQVVYQANQVIKKNRDDLDFRTASYSALIDKSLAVNLPASCYKPSTITVLLPAGSAVYKPYDISISCGSATFYNLTTVSSGSQVVLYQGTPYCYKVGSDVSPYISATDFSSDITIVGKKRYVRLTSATYPDSVEVYSLHGVFTQNISNTVLSQKQYYVNTLKDNTVAVQVAESFNTDSDEWCIRFLSLTSIEFDIQDINLPEGFSLLSSQVGSEYDLVYARAFYSKQHFIQTGVRDSGDTRAIHYVDGEGYGLVYAFPNIQDATTDTSGSPTQYTDVWIKPLLGGETVIYDELENFLNKYAKLYSQNVFYNTYCADSEAFNFLISVENEDVFTEALKARIESYLASKYSYESTHILEDIRKSEIKSELMSEFGLSATDFDINIHISRYVNSPAKITLGGQINKKKQLTFTANNLVGWDTGGGAARNLKGVTKPYTDNLGLNYPNLCLNTAVGLHSGNSKIYSLSTHCLSSITTTTNPSLADSDTGYVAACNAVILPYKTSATEHNVIFYDIDDPYWNNPNGTVPTSMFTAIGEYGRNDVATAIYSNVLHFGFSPCVAWDGDMTTPRIYTVTKDCELIIGGLDEEAFILRIPSSAECTALSLYNDTLYISCEDSTMLVIRGASSLTASTDFTESNCMILHILKSDGTKYPDCSNIDFYFTGRRRNTTIDFKYPVFTAVVNRDGGMYILYQAPDLLDNLPSGLESVRGYDDREDVKRKIRSHWKFFKCDRIKITTHGLYQINTTEVADLPTLSDYRSFPCEIGTNTFTGFLFEAGPYMFTGFNRDKMTFAQIQDFFPNSTYYPSNLVTCLIGAGEYTRSGKLIHETYPWYLDYSYKTFEQKWILIPLSDIVTAGDVSYTNGTITIKSSPDPYQSSCVVPAQLDAYLMRLEGLYNVRTYPMLDSLIILWEYE